jgi:transglutaminase/protease-like cytokinesis protein 3
MKFFFFYLNFLICFTKLIDEVRQNIVRKALLDLPKRQNTDILKMLQAMASTKKKYSLTETESAFFALSWISQNIIFDCSTLIADYSSKDPATLYKEGKGGSIAYAELFTKICKFLKVEANTILGLKKARILRDKEHLVKIMDFAWNSIFIDNKYYLIEIVEATGGCFFNENYMEDKTPYSYTALIIADNFGIENLELFNRYHFPNDEKWQLLNKTITKKQFYSIGLLEQTFYDLNFTSISPDLQTIRNQDEIKVKLTYDTSKISFKKENVDISAMSIYGESVIYCTISNINFSKGTIEFTISGYHEIGYITIFLDDSTKLGLIHGNLLNYEISI